MQRRAQDSEHGLDQERWKQRHEPQPPLLPRTPNTPSTAGEGDAVRGYEHATEERLDSASSTLRPQQRPSHKTHLRDVLHAARDAEDGVHGFVWDRTQHGQQSESLHLSKSICVGKTVPEIAFGDAQ